MTQVGHLVHLLRNTPLRKLISAVEKDGFSLKRETRTGERIYAHPDGRIVLVHYHRSGANLTRKTLESVLRATRWTENDLKRLMLIR